MSWNLIIWQTKSHTSEGEPREGIKPSVREAYLGTRSRRKVKVGFSE